MRYPFQSTKRPFHTEIEWPFRVYMIPERVFVPEQKSRPGTATGMNSFRYESYRYEILDRYYVNEYRARRGNRDELIPV